MKNTKSYQEAIEFLNRLPLGTTELDVIIKYATDEVDIHYKVEPGAAIPHYIMSKALHYIEDINKAVRKEHEIPIKVVESHKELTTKTYSFKDALTVLKEFYNSKMNNLEILIEQLNVIIISRQENENFPYLEDSYVKTKLDKFISKIELKQKELQEKLDEEKNKFNEKLNENTLPKVASFFENLLSKLDEIDMAPIETIREKAEQLIKEQKYERWDDSPFGKSVVEMKKLLESLDTITEDSFFERIKSKVQAYNRQVIALNDSRKELDKLFSDLPNKEKFSVNYDQSGFVDVVQVPAISFIKRNGVRFLNSEGSKIDGYVYELQQDGTYIEVINYDINKISIKYFSDDFIIAEERVPFDRFTITKSENRTFAVEVIDKPVF